MFRSGQRLLPLVRSGARSYLSAAEYQQRVPAHLRAALEATPLEPQPRGEGVCHFRASAARSSVQRRFVEQGHADMRGTGEWSDRRWTQRNEDQIDHGRPAVVRGHRTATHSSEWAGGGRGHAIAVLSRTTDGDGFVVFDPDTTHDPRTEAPASAATPREVRQDLRVMTSDELRAVGEVVEDLGQGDYSSLPVVEQRGPTLLGGVKAQLWAMSGLDDTPKK